MSVNYWRRVIHPVKCVQLESRSDFSGGETGDGGALGIRRRWFRDQFQSAACHIVLPRVSLHFKWREEKKTFSIIIAPPFCSRRRRRHCSAAGDGSIIFSPAGRAVASTMLYTFCSAVPCIWWCALYGSTAAKIDRLNTWGALPPKYRFIFEPGTLGHPRAGGAGL